ncbi:unnamed protein product, partial [Tuber aestivum]
VVKQLLDREDVNPNTVDKKGRTPLNWATMKGHECVIRQLLGHKD